MYMNTRSLLLAFAAVAFVSSSHAGSLQRADVPAEPGWVAHVDLDAVRPTPVGQFILQEMDKPEVQRKFAAFNLIFNFDPRTQLHGMTVYGMTKSPEDGVLMVYGDFDAGRLTKLAEAAHDYKSTTHNKHVIHNWIDEEKIKKQKESRAKKPG
ncbi:MAG: hypothetical protein JWO95_3544, partial [Verrucomicrobiales bacterium]|nr:hypothetical protein [Verrucomicrobiales bacterium]